MSGDKRVVTTDALETLGSIHAAPQKRDAIHLAVEPVSAGERLRPGGHINIIDGIAYAAEVGAGLGIVDPFLAAPVKRGERFWFVMYPRMVHSLRHVWTHPAFVDEPAVGAATEATPDSAKAASEQWLRDFCEKADCPGYETVMAAIRGESTVDTDGYGGSRLDDEYLHFDGSDAHGEIPAEFWHHAEIVIGKKLPHAEYFSCSC